MSVPLYDTLGTEAIRYIIDKGKAAPCRQLVHVSVSFDLTFCVSAASISTIVCDVADKVNLVLACVKDRKHAVKTIIVMETPSADLVDRGHRAGIHILSLQETEVRPSGCGPAQIQMFTFSLKYSALLVYLRSDSFKLLMTWYVHVLFSWVTCQQACMLL